MDGADTLSKIESSKWQNMGGLESRSYTCGYCDNPIASNLGYSHEHDTGRIYICHYCGRPTFFDGRGSGTFTIQMPGIAFGESVKYLPPDVEGLYKEARDCLKVSAVTASVLCSRKLLMNIAVAKGAKDDLKFVEYVDYLEEQRYLPIGGQEWANHIRDKGNEATHEITAKTQQEAEDLILFVQTLLRIIFENPGLLEARKQADVVNPS